MKVRDTLIEDIQALLYSGSPHGRLAHLRELLDSGELRDEAARQRIEDLVRQAQETLVAGQCCELNPVELESESQVLDFINVFSLDKVVAHADLNTVIPYSKFC